MFSLTHANQVSATIYIFIKSYGSRRNKDFVISQPDNGRKREEVFTLRFMYMQLPLTFTGTRQER